MVRTTKVQRLMSGASFPEWHGKRLHERTCDRFRIVGIDKHRAPEVDRSADETGQDEDAWIVWILSGHIFLRDEVHAVPQWRH